MKGETVRGTWARRGCVPVGWHVGEFGRLALELELELDGRRGVTHGCSSSWHGRGVVISLDLSVWNGKLGLEMWNLQSVGQKVVVGGRAGRKLHIWSVPDVYC